MFYVKDYPYSTTTTGWSSFDTSGYITNDPKRKQKDNWKNRDDGMICKSCMFFVPKNGASDQTIGRCRRHCPAMNGFPVVYETDWCGDHKLA